jgi:hypothetical protein
MIALPVRAIYLDVNRLVSHPREPKGAARLRQKLN